MGGYVDRRNRLVTAVRDAGGTIGLAKDTSNLFRDRAGKRKRLLDVRAFNHVLAVDAENGWIEAEGMTTYEELVARALGASVMPAVVPQLKTITLGGAAAGVGIEASSFKYGLVHESLLELEVLTGDGRALICRPDNEHRDLFYGFPNSYGTLGYALRLRAGAVPVKPFVELTHRRFAHVEPFFDALAESCAGDADFIDGVAFGPGELYLNVCRFVQAAPYTSDYTFKHIYYRSIRDRERDYLAVRDFIWRWDTDWFWCSKNLGAQLPWIRRLYGRERLGSRTYQRIMRWNSRWGLTRALDRIRGGHAESLIQDVDIPVGNAARFLDFFQREIGIAPVWICPIAGTARAGEFPLYPMRPRQLYVNFGFWDVVRRAARYAPGHFNRMIESKVSELGGIKSLYSDSYYPREAFWNIYGGDAYRALKARYDPGGVFPDLYDKCVLRR
ncbi:MAG: FAD-linked oxidase [Betaproteobacteria bacterium RIFCSPLOWO2_12_FULL_62_58]|nr:MAG: FAD-linked oxidase [Betaproteobacteria bacterium RIFCSPLOWO2_12_FULL_62_58]